MRSFKQAMIPTAGSRRGRRLGIGQGVVAAIVVLFLVYASWLALIETQTPSGSKGTAGTETLVQVTTTTTSAAPQRSGSSDNSAQIAVSASYLPFDQFSSTGSTTTFLCGITLFDPRLTSAYTGARLALVNKGTGVSLVGSISINWGGLRHNVHPVGDLSRRRLRFQHYGHLRLLPDDDQVVAERIGWSDLHGDHNPAERGSIPLRGDLGTRDYADRSDSGDGG
jgi:hypothetical protein